MSVQDLKPSEIVYLLMGFLTTRDGKLVLGAAHDSAPAARAIEEFEKKWRLEPARDDWSKILDRPAR